jgi:midasin
LAPGLRNRFTEFFVDELDTREDLKTVVLSYLKDIGSYSGVADDVVSFYLEARECAQKTLTGNALREIIAYIRRWSES